MSKRLSELSGPKGLMVSVLLIALAGLEVGGKQSQTAAAPSEYLSLAIRIESKDSVEVVKAQFIKGKLIQRGKVPSNFIYEVTWHEQCIAVGFVPNDAFVSRTFMSSTAGEKVEKARTVIITVDVPLATTTAKRDFSLRIYKLKAADYEQEQELDDTVLRRLKSQRLVLLEVEVPASRINAALNKHE